MCVCVWSQVQGAADALGLKHRDKIEFYFNRTLDRGSFRNLSPEERDKRQLDAELSEGEAATTLAMHDYCTNEKKHGRAAMVFYLHNKGGCCVRRPEPAKEGYRRAVASWREVMNTFNIEFPSICLRAMLDGYR